MLKASCKMTCYLMVSINRTWHYDRTYFLCVSEELPKLMDSGWLRRQHASRRNPPRIFKEECLNTNAVQLPPDVPLKERKIDPPVWTLSIRGLHGSTWIQKPEAQPESRAGSGPKLLRVPRTRVGFCIRSLGSRVIKINVLFPNGPD